MNLSEEIAALWSSPKEMETNLLNDSIDVKEPEEDLCIGHSSPIDIPESFTHRKPDDFSNSIDSEFDVGLETPSTSHSYPLWSTNGSQNSYQPSPFLFGNSFNTSQSLSVDPSDFAKPNFMTYDEPRAHLTTSSVPNSNNFGISGNNPFFGTGNNPSFGTSGHYPFFGTGNNASFGTGINSFANPGSYSSIGSGSNTNFISRPSFSSSYDEASASALTRNLLLSLTNSGSYRPTPSRSCFSSDSELISTSLPQDHQYPRFLSVVSPDVYSLSKSAEYASSRNKKVVCNFCKRNGEEFFEHKLKDSQGKVICPVLSSFKCKLCQATGQYAHTWKYCPLNPFTKGKPTRTGLPPGVPLEKIFSSAFGNFQFRN